MAHAIEYAGAANECQVSLRTAQLELDFEKSLALTRQLIADDSLRTLRVEQVLLEADNDGLRRQLETTSDNATTALQAEASLRERLNDAFDEITRLQNALQAECQELERLKQIAPPSDTPYESKRLVEENKRIAKELSSLRPEVERLRAQSASHETLFTEKLSLEQQLKALESQLKDEKRAAERTRAGDTAGTAEEITKLSVNIKELRNEVAKESSARQQLEEEIKKQGIDRENEKAALENKLEALRKKLRTTKEKLKTAQDELQRHGSVTKDEDMDEAPPLRSNGNTRQQGSSNFDTMTINTPGAAHVSRNNNNNNSKHTALPGHKSTFSITPFLSRTGAPPDSPDSPNSVNYTSRRLTSYEDNEDKGIPDADNDASSIPKPARKASAVNKRSDTERQKQVSRPTQDAKSTNARGGVVAGQSSEIRSSSNEISMPKQIKPRKRKLLGGQRGATLFDEEEDVVQEKRNVWKSALGEKRTLIPGPSKGHSSSAMGADIDGTSGGFSPLKRDRRKL
ncbi:hypothetical protein PVAR5_7317 [Paecilomyces variotii No. 5]|uniref:Uncharacterized protein n=1 Tax=Byssochlamys spectabilis (strain No. 5 / NBRC 109023) TaxID=1356009 RepID=V5G2J2_BYSSN|nr:hypothetical protein PVAR5_7317 [Paecilomyces variotii No. 5]